MFNHNESQSTPSGCVDGLSATDRQSIKNAVRALVCEIRPYAALGSGNGTDFWLCLLTCFVHVLREEEASSISANDASAAPHANGSVTYTSADSASRDHSPYQQPGYLGLMLGPRKLKRCTVDEDDREIELSRLEWEVFLKIYRRRDRFCSFEEIRSVWQDLGLDRRVAKPSARKRVDTELYRLRVKLAPLGVAIENDRDIGWRLIDSPDLAC